MKIKLFASLLVFLLNNIYAQKPSFDIYELVPPNSISIQNWKFFKGNYQNSFAFYMVHGATAFNTKTDILKIDLNTLEEKNKISFPEIKGYKNISLSSPSAVMLTDNLVFFHKKSMGNKLFGIFASRLTENFDVSSEPKYLFSVNENDFNFVNGIYMDNIVSNFDNDNSLNLLVNDNKNLFLLSYHSKPDKLNNQKYFTFLIDNNLNIVKSDSSIHDVKLESSNNFYSLIMNDGYASIEYKDKVNEITVYNQKNNEKTKITYKSKVEVFRITDIKFLNNKLVFIGSYSEKMSNGNVSNGCFKVTFNLMKKIIEEETYFSHEPKGTKEYNQAKHFFSTSIRPDGTAYFVICQRASTLSSQGFPEVIENKYEVMCINSKSEKWRKQLPIDNKKLKEVFYFNNTIYLLGYCNENYDLNNFEYDNPLILKKNLYALNVDAARSILKINSSGEVKRNMISFIDNKYDSLNWYNSTIFSGKTKTRSLDFLKITLTE
jgi:hypothetical protein